MKSGNATHPPGTYMIEDHPGDVRTLVGDHFVAEHGEFRSELNRVFHNVRPEWLLAGAVVGAPRGDLADEGGDDAGNGKKPTAPISPPVFAHAASGGFVRRG